ncbi:unnamed protein product, partial [Dovyalis caffra]
KKLRRKSFSGEITCEDQGTATSSGGLRLSSFAGLFIISGVASDNTWRTIHMAENA